MYRLVYHVFGSGAMHSPFACFKYQSTLFNDGHFIGLLWPANTRMGSWFLCICHMLRVWPAHMAALASAAFRAYDSNHDIVCLVMMILKIKNHVVICLFHHFHLQVTNDRALPCRFGLSNQQWVVLICLSDWPCNCQINWCTQGSQVHCRQILQEIDTCWWHGLLRWLHSDCASWCKEASSQGWWQQFGQNQQPGWQRWWWWWWYRWFWRRLRHGWWHLSGRTQTWIANQGTLAEAAHHADWTISPFGMDLLPMWGGQRRC